jgi:tetratricopeptide (TPR) repeat protein
MVREELASREDGMVSAVDIQVLSWVIAGLPDSKQRAFNRESVKMSGGVEGLLERYLQRSLAAVPHLREPATKILLTLIDLNQDARAGALSSKEISNRLEGTILQKTLTDALNWVADPRVRLVFSFSRHDQVVYQIVHERLIPALKKTAFGILGESGRANEILNKRVREWLDHGRSERYLLTWAEWRLVLKQRSFVVWGANQQQKEEFLRLTLAQWRRRAMTAGCLVLLAGGVTLFVYSRAGQIFSAKWELRTYLNGDVSSGTREAIVAQLRMSRPLLNQARMAAESIREPFFKARALESLAEALAKEGDTKQAAAMFKQTWKEVEKITNPVDRERSLQSLAWELVQDGATGKDTALLEQAREVADSVTEPDSRGTDLRNLGVALAKDGDLKQAATVFEQARKVADSTTDPSTKASALKNLAAAVAQAGTAGRDTNLFEQARKVAESVTDPHEKASALQSLGVALAQGGDPKQAATAFEQARKAAESITDPD